MEWQRFAVRQRDARRFEIGELGIGQRVGNDDKAIAVKQRGCAVRLRGINEIEVEHGNS